MAESISEAVSLLATRVGTECKSLVDKIGELSELSTTTRSDLVSALNELAELASSASGLSGDVGSGTNPVYLDDGTITASAETVGSGTQPIYLSSGTLTVSSSTVGSSKKPIYLSSGTLTVSSSTVGSATTPVYLSSGAITSTGKVLGLNLYKGASALDLSPDENTPDEVFSAMSSPSILVEQASNCTADDWDVPSSYGFVLIIKYNSSRASMLFLSKQASTSPDYRRFLSSSNTFDGTSWYVSPIAASATVGSSSTPVYLKNGVLTACSSSLSGSSGGDADGVSLANETDETE